MPAALAKAPNTSTTIRAAMSWRRPKRPDAGPLAVVPQLGRGETGDQPDVLVRAGVDAIEAGGAVHVARLARQEQVQLAAGDAVAAADAILRLARRAHGWVTRLDLQRRDQRLHEIELADRADVFAEGGAAEQAVDDEGRREIAQRRAMPSTPAGPRGPAPRMPTRKRRSGGSPATCSAGAAASSSPPAGRAAGKGTRQQKGTAHAKDVAGRQQPEDEQAAPVNPRQDAGQVHRARPGGHAGRRRSSPPPTATGGSANRAGRVAISGNRPIAEGAAGQSRRFQVGDRRAEKDPTQVMRSGPARPRPLASDP